MCFCCEVTSRFSHSANQRTASGVSGVKGHKGVDPDILGGKIISVLIFRVKGRILLKQNRGCGFLDNSRSYRMLSGDSELLTTTGRVVR